MNTITTILVVIALLALAFLGLALKILFSKDKKFPNMHIGSNPNMKARGITCAQSWDKTEQKSSKKIDYNELKISENK